MVKIYLRGPMDDYTLPLNPEYTESLVFLKKAPGVPPESVQVEVKDDIARDLLTSPRANFRTVDPAEMDRLFPPDAPRTTRRGRRGDTKTSLPANSPAVEKDNETPVNPLVPVNVNDPLVKEAINDPTRTR
jgi:hypothetical protein